MTEAYHTKYRPRSWATVVGQDAVVKSLSKAIEKKLSQTFLFSGPSGTGKTTLARIAAKILGCRPEDILEIDAATSNGVDAMRQVQETTRYRPFGEATYRVIIIDECHSLSKAAWQSLLKITEHPPAHVIWFFCTTEVGKVPITIKTRAMAFTLKPVKDQDIERVVDRVIDKEQLEVTDAIRDLVIKHAQNSPRQALVNLATCVDVTSTKEAAELLRTVLESNATIEFCQYLIKGGSWVKAMVIYEKFEDENPESVRIMVCNYMAACLKRSKTDNDACHFLGILDAFATPYNQSEGLAPLLVSMGRVLFK